MFNLFDLIKTRVSTFNKLLCVGYITLYIDVGLTMTTIFFVTYYIFFCLNTIFYLFIYLFYDHDILLLSMLHRAQPKEKGVTSFSIEPKEEQDQREIPSKRLVT